MTSRNTTPSGFKQMELFLFCYGVFVQGGTHSALPGGQLFEISTDFFGKPCLIQIHPEDFSIGEERAKSFGIRCFTQTAGSRAL